MASRAGYLMNLLQAVAIVFVCSMFTSCISQKRVLYFTDIPDTASARNPVVVESPKYIDPVIIPNDNLIIYLQNSEQAESSTPVNASTGGNGQNNQFSGYLVDKNGMIDYPLIGFIKVGGLTTHEAAQLIKEKAKEFYKFPVVRLRIMNFEVSTIGEVRGPGIRTYPNEKVNVIEAISDAGDLNITGRRDNILLIRTEGDSRKFARFNLNSTEIFKSPYFYLKQRDIIYVKPSKYKIQSSDNQLTRNVSIISSLISLALVFVAIRNIK